MRSESESFLTGGMLEAGPLQSPEQCWAKAVEETRRIKQRMVRRAHSFSIGASSSRPSYSPTVYPSTPQPASVIRYSSSARALPVPIADEDCIDVQSEEQYSGLHSSSIELKDITIGLDKTIEWAISAPAQDAISSESILVERTDGLHTPPHNCALVYPLRDLTPRCADRLKQPCLEYFGVPDCRGRGADHLMCENDLNMMSVSLPTWDIPRSDEPIVRPVLPPLAIVDLTGSCNQPLDSLQSSAKGFSDHEPSDHGTETLANFMADQVAAFFDGLLSSDEEDNDQELNSENGSSGPRASVNQTVRFLTDAMIKAHAPTNDHLPYNRLTDGGRATMLSTHSSGLSCAYRHCDGPSKPGSANFRSRHYSLSESKSNHSSGDGTPKTKIDVSGRIVVPNLSLPTSPQFSFRQRRHSAPSTNRPSGLMSPNREPKGIIGTVQALRLSKNPSIGREAGNLDMSVMLSSRSGMTYNFDEIALRHGLASPREGMDDETSSFCSAMHTSRSCEYKVAILEDLPIRCIPSCDTSEGAAQWTHTLLQKHVLEAIVLTSAIDVKYSQWMKKLKKTWGLETKSNVNDCLPLDGECNSVCSIGAQCDVADEVAHEAVLRLGPALHDLESAVAAVHHQQERNGHAAGERRLALARALLVGDLLGEFLSFMTFGKKHPCNRHIPHPHH